MLRVDAVDQAARVDQVDGFLLAPALHGVPELLDQEVLFFFVRCHNGIIVNVDCIESLHDLTIKLYSGDKIYITRSRKQNLMKKMAERGGCI